jgi:NAD(P)-dependent dehydrogenase (short-subunit alcohol dehydrogenase family)
MKDLTGKVALITGASRGIGAAVAQLLAEQGADIVINYRSKGSRAEEVAAKIIATGGRAILAQADITHENDVSDLIEGTITPKLMERAQPGFINERREQAGSLPTVADFANAIADVCVNSSLSSGETIFVGSTEW